VISFVVEDQRHPEIIKDAIQLLEDMTKAGWNADTTGIMSRDSLANQLMND
jgi:hypothetical protein